MTAPVVDLDWCQAHREEVVLADARWYLDGRSGREAYDQGHLPGAVFVELETWCSGPGSPAAGRHPLPDPERFAEGMARLGIADEDTVVAYDDAGGVIAARLVWMLRATGHRAALLDGGLGVYDGPLERDTPRRTPASFSARPWPAERLAGIEEVAARAGAGEATIVLDARNRERYRGDHEGLDHRSGHIPGARSLPCRENLDERGRFLPAEQLRERFADAGVSAGASVVSYCGSGVTACHNLLALELAGFGPGRLYPGSWSQYSHASGRPIATGDVP